MNLRKDHYRVRVSPLGGITGPNLPPFVVEQKFVALAGPPVLNRRLPGPTTGHAPARGKKNSNSLYEQQSEQVIDKSIKTFNNGSLGSGIDEERSEMR